MHIRPILKCYLAFSAGYNFQEGRICIPHHLGIQSSIIIVREQHLPSRLKFDVYIGFDIVVISKGNKWYKPCRYRQSSLFRVDVRQQALHMY